MRVIRFGWIFERLRSYLRPTGPRRAAAVEASSQELDSSILNGAILNAVTEGVYGLDREGIATFVNRAAAELTGWREDELIGKRLHDLIHRTEPDGRLHREEDCPICAVCRTGNVHHEAEDLFWRKDGTSFPVSYTPSPLLNGGIVVGSVVAFQDLTDRKDREREAKDRQQELERLLGVRTEELHRTTAQLSSVLEAAALVAVFAWEPNGTVSFFNKGAEKMLGYKAREVVGKTTAEIFHLREELERRGPEPAAEHGSDLSALEALAAAALSENPDAREGTFVRKDGTHLPVCFSVTAMLDETGAATSFLGIAYDISRQKLAEKTLIAAKQNELANRVKTESLATMSHEIRTALNGILGMADLLLLKNDLELSPRERALTLRDSADVLICVLNDMLDLSKLEASHRDLEVADFDLRGIVERIADLMRVAAQEKGVELTYFIESDVPTQLRGNRARLRQVLVNVIGNAVKFTREGAISVRVKRGPAERPESIRFEVTDNGIGVGSERQDLTVKKISNVDRSTNDLFDRAERVLSIIRGPVALMQGEAGVHNDPDKGSTFWFTVPLPRQVGSQIPPPLSLVGKRFLIADRNAASRSVLKDFFAIWRCDGEEAADSESALYRLRDGTREPLDAVVIALDMPPLHGVHLGAAIRTDHRLADLPIVLLTPLDQSDGRGEWESEGFVGRVSKPVKQGDLGRCLAAAMGYTPVPRAFPEASEPSIAGRGEQKARTRLLVVEDNLVNQQVAMGLLDHLGYQADIVSDGQSALRALREVPYNLVLSDCEMPEMDGYELTRLIRQPSTKVLNPRIPIIAVTAHCLSGDRQKCLASGMDDFLAKPLRAKSLRDMLFRWIGDENAPADSVETAAPDPEPAIVQEPEIAAPLPIPVSAVLQFDTEDLVERLMGNEKLARRVAGAFVDCMPQQLASLAQAIRSFDAPAAKLAAHTIKGAAANVGTEDIRKLASRIETLGEAGDLTSASEIFPELNASFQSLKPAVQRFCDSED